VLKDVPRPPAEVVIPGAAITSTSTPNVMLQTPIAPVTPVTAEALTSLHNMIKQDTNVPGGAGGRIQELTGAVRISFAERALLKDRNRFLFKINNEAEARRSTRSIVLGKAKAKRAATEEAAARKEQHGRKRKGPALETDVVRVNEVLAPTNTLAPWRALVVQMC